MVSKGAETRIAVLDDAADLASVVGLTGLTIGTLADRAQMSKSGLFAHFRSKEALQAAVMEHVQRQFTESVIIPALRAPRGEPRLRELFRLRLDWSERPRYSGGCVLIASMSELDDQPGPARDILVQAQRDWLDVIATIVRSGIAEGAFRADTNPEQVAFTLNGIFIAHQLHGRLLGEPSSDFAWTAFEDIVDRIRS